MPDYRFDLERTAKSLGGDRYECTDVITNGKPWMVYFPQEISRGKDGAPKPYLIVSVED